MTPFKKITPGEELRLGPTAEGFLFTPLHGRFRVELRLDDADSRRIRRGHPWQATVKDQLTGKKVVVRGAGCGLPGCFCDAVVMGVKE